MVVSTKRKNLSNSKSKTLSKSKKVSSSRKHLIKSRKSGSKTRKMRGGGGKKKGNKPPSLGLGYKVLKKAGIKTKTAQDYATKKTVYEDAERLKKVEEIIAKPTHDTIKTYKALSNTIHRRNLQQASKIPGFLSAKNRLSRSEVKQLIRDTNLRFALYQELLRKHPEGAEGLHRELGLDRSLYPSHQELTYLNLHGPVEKMFTPLKI